MLCFDCVVQVFDLTGTFLRKFELDGCAGMAFDRADNLLVCATRKDQVHVLTTAGEFVTAFDVAERPSCVHVDAEERVLVGHEEGNVRVFAFV